MKFIKKINRNYIGLTLILFMLIAAISYVVIDKIILLNAKEDLAEKKVIIKNEILKTGLLPQLYPLYETKKVNYKQDSNNKCNRLVKNS